MTTSTATILPRRERSEPGTGERFSIPVAGGYTSDGEPAGALFLWAASRINSVYEFGLHRHEGLEILTVVLEGTMSHYDTASGRWMDLHAGDAQLMEAGSGVSHEERAASGTRAFQIQFDPGYDAALRQRPSYTDYSAASFTVHPVGDAQVTELIGDGGPIGARAEGLSVRRVTVPSGSHAELGVGPGRFTLAYMIDGEATVNGAHAASDDAIAFGGASTITADATAPTDLFVVSVPANPSYQPQRRDLRELGGHP
jgi:quercetin 2,3-dioxygenase